MEESLKCVTEHFLPLSEEVKFASSIPVNKYCSAILSSNTRTPTEQSYAQISASCIGNLKALETDSLRQLTSPFCVLAAR